MPTTFWESPMETVMNNGYDFEADWYESVKSSLKSLHKKVDDIHGDQDKINKRVDNNRNDIDELMSKIEGEKITDKVDNKVLWLLAIVLLIAVAGIVGKDTLEAVGRILSA